MSIAPIKHKKDSANSLILAFCSTKFAIEVAETIITMTAILIESPIFQISSTNPTTVMTESNEKTKSKAIICTRINATLCDNEFEVCVC